MKKYILLVIIAITALSGCKVGSTTESRGLDNQAYLQFVKGNTIDYNDGVEVFVDDSQPFIAKVDKVKRQTVKGNTYIINSGKRHLKVVYKGHVLYEKDIIVTTQETRRIQLP